MRKIVLLITILICHWGYSQVAGLITMVTDIIESSELKVPENVKYSKIGFGLETGHISSRSTLSTPISSEFYHPYFSVGKNFSLQIGLFMIAKKLHNSDSNFLSKTRGTIGFNYSFLNSNEKFYLNTGLTFHLGSDPNDDWVIKIRPLDFSLYQAIVPHLKIGYNFNAKNNIYLGVALRNNRLSILLT